MKDVIHNAEGRVIGFTIYEDEWGDAHKLRKFVEVSDHTKANSLLYNKASGLKCCVGFYASACGVPDSTLAGLQTVVQVAVNSDSATMRQLNWLFRRDSSRFFVSTKVAESLYSANDQWYTNLSRPLPPLENIKQDIASLFAEQGITVTFQPTRKTLTFGEDLQD